MPRVLSAHRCPACEIGRPLCFCAMIPQITLQTCVIILMHTSEEVVPSNTARLAHKSLPNSEIRINGRIGDRLSNDGLVETGRQSLLLYPSPHAAELTEEFVSGLKRPVTLIVPDGKWRQTRKYARRGLALAGIPHVKVPAGAPSQYQLRTQPNARSRSTLEAIARALGALEIRAAQVRLEALLSMMVKRPCKPEARFPQFRENGWCATMSCLPLLIGSQP